MVEKALRDRQSDLTHLRTWGDSAIDEIAGPDAVFLTEDERIASDVWAPLDIDRDDPEYIEVVKSVDEALERIRGDNGYATERASERSGVIAALEDGLDWLKNRNPSKAQILAKLVSPLRYIAAQFAKALMGEAARNALRRVLEWMSRF